MIKVILIDDENNAIKMLSSYLERYIDGVRIVGTAQSKKSAVALIRSTDFDLALLDINLGDGTGFDVLEATSDVDYSVIFTTAYDQHAIKAFKYSALDYLLKPIDPEEFIATFKRYKSLDLKTQKSQLSHASTMVKSGSMDRMVVNSSNEIHFIDISDVIRLESYKNYTDIHLVSGSKITSTKTLKFYENLLTDSSFYRIHQKHLVNINFIKKYLKEDGGYVLLSNDAKLEVSRRKKEELLKTLTQ